VFVAEPEGDGNTRRPRRNRKREPDRNSKRDYCGCGKEVADCGCFGCDLLLLGRLLNLVALSTPGHPPRSRPSGPGRLGILLILGYRRWLTDRLPTSCRHTPTCSSYGLTAVRRYGLATGTRLILGRLSRCTHATPPGTVDPVP
jgi:uncharacterized protein